LHHGAFAGFEPSAPPWASAPSEHRYREVVATCICKHGQQMPHPNCSAVQMSACAAFNVVDQAPAHVTDVLRGDNVERQRKDVEYWAVTNSLDAVEPAGSVEIGRVVDAGHARCLTVVLVGVSSTKRSQDACRVLKD